MSNANITKLNTTMTDERKKEALWLFEKLCEMAQEPEKAIKHINAYEAEEGTEKNKAVCDILRKSIYALSGNSHKQ